MKQWTDIIESLMSLGNIYYTSKSLFEGRSDSVKGHLALDMKQSDRETEYFKEYWRAKCYCLWDNLPDGSAMFPVMLKHAGEKFEQVSCDLMTSGCWEHDAVSFLSSPMMLFQDARLWDCFPLKSPSPGYPTRLAYQILFVPCERSLQKKNLSVCSPLPVTEGEKGVI